LGMAFAPDKGFVMVTTSSSAARLAKTTRLGVDYALDPQSRVMPARWHRLAVSLARAKRMPHLYGAPGIHTFGILLAALYGAEHQAIPPPAVQKLRHTAVRAGGSRPWGAPTDFAMLLYPTDQDPFYIAIAAPLARWAREVWVSTAPEGPADDDTLIHVELVLAARAIADDRPLPQGPLLAVRQALAQIGWTMQPPFHFCNHTGYTLNLSEGTPALLRHHIRKRVASLQERSFRDRLYERPSAITPR
jgi:hypothetical protein